MDVYESTLDVRMHIGHLFLFSFPLATCDVVSILPMLYFSDEAVYDLSWKAYFRSAKGLCLFVSMMASCGEHCVMMYLKVPDCALQVSTTARAILYI